jgi:hypothetical protein
MYYVNDINLVPKMGQIIKVQRPVSSTPINGLYPTICLKRQVFQIWHNLCSELTSMGTFKIYSRNTKTTNEPIASNNKSDRPQVKIWNTASSGSRHESPKLSKAA